MGRKLINRKALGRKQKLTFYVTLSIPAAVLPADLNLSLRARKLAFQSLLTGALVAFEQSLGYRITVEKVKQVRSR